MRRSHCFSGRRSTGWPPISLLPSITSRSEEHTSELQSQSNLVCRLLLEKKNTRCHRLQTWFDQSQNHSVVATTPSREVNFDQHLLKTYLHHILIRISAAFVPVDLSAVNV